MNVFEQLDTQETLRRNGNQSQEKKGRPYFTARESWRNENRARENVSETKLERAYVLAKQK